MLSRAEKMRRRGYSLREISEDLGISKSTASLWTSGVKVGKKGIERMQNIREKGLEKSRRSREEQKKLYLQNISENCSVLGKGTNYSKDDLKIFLALLFWGEGSKSDRRLVFINSDPEMIQTYLFLLRSSFNIDNSKLRAIVHLHEYHDKNEQINYWSRITSINKKYISVYQKKNTGQRKKNNYNGCISVRYGDTKILDELFLIIERFKRYSIAGVG